MSKYKLNSNVGLIRCFKRALRNQQYVYAIDVSSTENQPIRICDIKVERGRMFAKSLNNGKWFVTTEQLVDIRQ